MNVLLFMRHEWHDPATSQDLSPLKFQSDSGVKWDGPLADFFLAGGEPGATYKDLNVAKSLCLYAADCEGITGIAEGRQENSMVWQLRLGKGLWLQSSPSHEVSYKWRIYKLPAADHDETPTSNVWADPENALLQSACDSIQSSFVSIHAEPPNLRLSAEDIRRLLTENFLDLDSWVVNASIPIQRLVSKVIPPGSSEILFNDLMKVCKWKYKNDFPVKLPSENRKIAAVTVCMDGEATIAFTVGSLLQFVDLFIVIDAGSGDESLRLLRGLFADHIRAGKLKVMNLNTRADMMLSRNVALDIARAAHCTHILKIDSDDVFYDWGARDLVRAVKSMDADVQRLWVPQFELEQNRLNDVVEWLSALQPSEENGEPGPFTVNKGGYGHDRGYLLSPDLKALGSWTDESKGQKAENFYHDQSKMLRILLTDNMMVHYGWARPLNRLRDKLRSWGILDSPMLYLDGSFTAEGQHFNHSQHPEIISRLSLKVKQHLVSSRHDLAMKHNKNLMKQCHWAGTFLSHSLLQRSSRIVCLSQRGGFTGEQMPTNCSCIEDALKGRSDVSVRTALLDDAVHSPGQYPFISLENTSDVANLGKDGISVDSFDASLLLLKNIAGNECLVATALSLLRKKNSNLFILLSSEKVEQHNFSVLGQIFRTHGWFLGSKISLPMVYAYRFIS